MEKHLGKEYANKAQREAFLKDNCEKVENKGYMKPFTPEQLQGHKENLAELSMKIEETEDEKKAAASHYKAVLDPLFKQRHTMVSNIRQKAETLEVETFAKINGREVAFILLSPGANQTLEEIRDKAIDEQLKQVREIAPDIAIIEV